MNLSPDLMKQPKGSWLALAMVVAAGAAGAALVILQARLLASVITRVFLDGASLTDVSGWMVTLLAVIVGRAVLVMVGDLSAHTAARKIKSRLREALYAKIQTSGPAFTRAERTGELIALAQAGIESLEAYYSQYLPQLALAALVPLAVLAAVFPLDLLSAAILLVTAPLIPFFMILIGKTAERLTRQQWTALSRLSAHFLDSLQGLTALKLLGRSRDHAESIARAGEAYRAATMEVLRVTFLSALALELLASISTAIVAVQIGLRLLKGGFAYEQALTILILAPEVYLPLRNLGLRFHAGAGAIAAGRRIFEVLGDESGAGLSTPMKNPSAGSPTWDPIPETAQGFPRQGMRPSSVRFTLPRWKRISFCGVGYTYPGAERSALEEVSFNLCAGQQVVLVGASGAGKSTLAALLLRFMDPTAGEIRVDGSPLIDIPAEVWRQGLAWVPQHPYLFKGTLADNLLIARPQATKEEIQLAAKNARLNEWISELPGGWDTPVGEGGTRISGGQAQRLALARAFLKDAPLLILDEPASNLDPLLADELNESTCVLMQGRTTLTIAHRMETAIQADQILVLDGGQLVEIGTHAGLIGMGGVYASLVGKHLENERWTRTPAAATRREQ